MDAHMNSAADTVLEPTDAAPVAALSKRADTVRLIALVVVVALLAALFWDAIANLWKRWGKQQELSHSYFIPLISIYLVWINRDTIRTSVGAPSIAGAGLLGGFGPLPEPTLAFCVRVTHDPTSPAVTRAAREVTRRLLELLAASRTALDV